MSDTEIGATFYWFGFILIAIGCDLQWGHASAMIAVGAAFAIFPSIKVLAGAK